MGFVEGITGTVIRLEEDENTRFRVEVWFDYTKRAMNLIREGAILAVRNFASTDQIEHLSLLEVVSLLPMHYALGDDPRGYPGFVVEAARNAMTDWETQTEEATEDVTKIRCLAIPTNLEIVRPSDADLARLFTLQEESNLPMVGATAHLLDSALTESVINHGIRPTENTLVAGVLIRDPSVRLRLRVDDLLQTHFGIFGFTGAGKSNLVSLLISRLLDRCGECAGCRNDAKCTVRKPVKIVLLDLMGEYSTLLIEPLVRWPHARWIVLGAKTLPDAVLAALSHPSDDTLLERAVADLCRTALLPRALAPYRDQFAYPFAQILRKRKIRVYQAEPTIGEFVESIKAEIVRGNMGNAASTVVNLVNGLIKNYRNTRFNEETVKSAIDEIDSTLKTLENESKITQTARNNLDTLKARFDTKAKEVAATPRPPEEATITIPQMIQALNEPDSVVLYIIQSHDPDQLREFAADLSGRLFEERRRSGQTQPLVSFVFDEADEFIPQQATDSYARSSGAAIMLARRGRKFGLGIGIATQRVRYLNTSIMAQPHTYFVSKMPRFSDRQAVAEAFGVSEEMFHQF